MPPKRAEPTQMGALSMPPEGQTAIVLFALPIIAACVVAITVIVLLTLGGGLDTIPFDAAQAASALVVLLAIGRRTDDDALLFEADLAGVFVAVAVLGALRQNLDTLAFFTDLVLTLAVAVHQARGRRLQAAAGVTGQARSAVFSRGAKGHRPTLGVASPSPHGPLPIERAAQATLTTAAPPTGEVTPGRVPTEPSILLNSAGVT